MTQTTKCVKGDKVVDLDGRKGIVYAVKSWEGNVWYEVCFDGAKASDTAVRYDGDLTITAEATGAYSRK